MGPEKQNMQANEKGDGRKKILIGIVAAVIIVLMVTVGVLASSLMKANENQGQATEETAAEKPRDVISAENVEEVMAQFEEDTRIGNIPQSYTVAQNTDWEFSAETMESQDAYVSNHSSNETPVYFDLVVDETGEIIYSSPILELGAEIKGFKLDKALDPGTYVCTVVYHLVDEEQRELTTVNIGVTITVH